MRTQVTASTIWPLATTRAVAPASTGATSCPTGATQFVVVSDPLPVDLCVYRGDSGRFRVAVSDPDTGDPLDISTATWDCDVRTGYDAEPPIVSLTVNPIDASTVEVILTPLMSALLVDLAVWDLQMTINNEVTTLMAGIVHVQKDVSRE